MKLTSLLLALTLLALQPVMACDYPQRPKIADGNTANKEELIASQKSVKTYMAAMEVYLDCIAEEEKAARAALEEPDEETLSSREKMLAKKHNAAVEEMEIVAAEFNEQVRVYKARSE